MTLCSVPAWDYGLWERSFIEPRKASFMGGRYPLQASEFWITRFLDHSRITGNPEIKRAVTLLASLNERPLKRSPNGPHLE
jgi:hypothetical protein